MARIGRPNFLQSVNKLAQAVTMSTRVCDRRPARWSHTATTRVTSDNIFTWETLPNRAEWDCSQDLEEFWIDFGRHHVHLRESNVCTDQLVMQEALFSLTQHLRVRGHFFGHFSDGWQHCSEPLRPGHCDFSSFSTGKLMTMKQLSSGKLVA